MIGMFICGRNGITSRVGSRSIPIAATNPMTPEERAKSVLHFLDEYLDARERAVEAALYAGRPLESPVLRERAEAARQFLGTALVALVTDAKEKVDPENSPQRYQNR